MPGLRFACHLLLHNQVSCISNVAEHLEDSFGTCYCAFAHKESRYPKEYAGGDEGHEVEVGDSTQWEAVDGGAGTQHGKGIEQVASDDIADGNTRILLQCCGYRRGQFG